MRLDFHLLGEVGASVGGRPLDLGHRRQRCVLAALIVDANRPVSADALIDRAWADQPPQHARTALAGYVSRLRKILAIDDQVRLDRRTAGYQLTLDPATVDLHRFADLVDRAAKAASADGGSALALLDEALGLWRGPALGDLDTPWAQAERAALEVTRYAAERDRTDLALEDGQHESLLRGLPTAASAHPLDERLAGQLMLALYRSGRQADALHHFERIRVALADELGVAPGPDLQALHLKILAAAPDLAWSGSRLAAHEAVPRQLPPATRDFSGREPELAWLDHAAFGEGSPTTATAVTVVTGTAGVGKTALALAWAHRVGGRFGDGQLYVHLRGHSASPTVDSFEAMAGFLRALGVPSARIPGTLDEAAALYRTILGEKRMLVVLDDARNAEQVRPLLPGSPACCVVVTSRHTLAGLVARDGARQLSLDVMSPAEAAALQASILGHDRIAADPEAAAALAEQCARLPLAIRIASARLLVDPLRPLAHEVTELESERRLDVLRIPEDEGSAVRVVFEQSYELLDSDARRLFRLLGLVPLVDATAPTAAALLDARVEVAAALLERLAASHLLAAAQPGRFSFHDLLRLFAAERAQADEAPADLAAAAHRLIDAYRVTADAADRVLSPERIRLPRPDAEAASMIAVDTPAEALAWFDAERANLSAVIRYAADHGPASAVWELAHSLRGYYLLRMHVTDWRSAATLAITAADDGGDPSARVTAHLGLGLLYERLGEFSRAAMQTARAIAWARRGGWLEAEAAALGDLALLCRLTGRPEEAARHYRLALDVARRTGHRSMIGSRLLGLGNLEAEAGRLASAGEHFAEALPIFTETGSRAGEAIALASLGECAVLLGSLPEALESFTKARRLNHSIGHNALAADNLRALASIHAEAGRWSEAVRLAETALSEARESGNPRYEADCLNTLATVQRRQGDPRQAAAGHRQALEVSREIGAVRHQIVALIGLAHCRIDEDRPADAIKDAGQALDVARRSGFQLLVGPALTVRGSALLASGDSAGAEAVVQEALVVLRATGQRLDEARALLVLGAVAERRGEAITAEGNRRAALDLLQLIGAAETA